MTEAQLQQAVIELARLLGWRVAHFRPAQTVKGWRTPVEADGKGFPDLVLVRGERLIFAELKCKGNGLTSEQERWMSALKRAGATFWLWRERDWSEGTIAELLR